MVDVIVIGGGPAGVTAALRARELGASVALVERERLGGTCTIDGCVPTRIFARAARLMRVAEQFEAYGLVGQQPSLDLSALLLRTGETVERVQDKKGLLDHIRKTGIELWDRTGEARFVDPHTITLGDGHHLTAEKFVICAGGHARCLTFPGVEHVLTNKDIWSLSELPRSMAIIGGSATGCQFASIFAAFGTRVTVLETSAAILIREDELISQALTSSFHRRGIEIIDSINSVNSIEKRNGSLKLSYQREEAIDSIQVEAVILAAGWLGNVDNLNLEAVGVATDRSYIVVDDYLQSSVPHIFAAGDITGRMMLVQSASHEARVAAENAVLGPLRLIQHHIVPHGGFTDPQYGSVGLTEAQARATHNYAATIVPYSDMDRAVIDNKQDGACKLIVSRDSHTILGAHVVGEQALEAVHVAATGIAANMTVTELADLELAYPTFGAIIGLAARRLVRELGLTPLSPIWRELCQIPQPLAEWETHVV